MFDILDHYLRHTQYKLTYCIPRVDNCSWNISRQLSELQYILFKDHDPLSIIDELNHFHCPHLMGNETIKKISFELFSIKRTRINYPVSFLWIETYLSNTLKLIRNQLLFFHFCNFHNLHNLIPQQNREDLIIILSQRTILTLITILPMFWFMGTTPSILAWEGITLSNT